MIPANTVSGTLAPAPGADDAPVAETLPLSFAQERLWFLDRMEPGSPFYNLPSPLRFRGALHVPALERALGEVVRRHETLRTTFAEAEDGPVQVIAPFAGFALPVDDLSALPAGAREAEVGRRAAGDAMLPFDLAAGPLFRARLLRVDAEDHVLLLCMHHAVSDGWSLGVLHRELSSVYAAVLRGEEPRLPELPVQYADFALWQREQLGAAALERQLAWWRERLAGAPALLELPTDHPRPPVQGDRGARVAMELPPVLAERLRAAGRAEGATLYVVLLAAWQALLARYTASNDVVVGTAAAGRERGELQGLIGFFANTLVMRTDLSGDPEFRELLRRVREATLGAYEHQDLPFEKLVAELQPVRTLAHSPLFQVMFVVREPEAIRGGFAGLRMEPVQAELGTVKFDLSLAFETGGGGLRAELGYRTPLFEHDTARRMLDHLGNLLEAVAADPSRRLSQLEILGGDERRRVLQEWNRGGAEPPAAAIHRLFEAQAARTPGAVAVVHEDGSLTYRELNERANRLAHRLAALGVRHETRVAVCLERGVDAVAGMLATLKAGGAYVPLDPAHPADRLAFVLADAGVAVLLTSRAIHPSLALPDCVAVATVEDDRVDGAAPSENPAGDSGPASLAYVMYTSGSTGTPKGVAVEHRGVVRLVRGADYAAFGAETVMLQAAPLSFDASTLEIWGALLSGGRLVMVPGSTPSLEALGRAITRHGVTTLWLTAGLFGAMVDERLDDLRGVRQLLAGGDVLPAEQVRRLRERFPACRVINGYGPTENTTFTCCHTVPAGWAGGPVPIGSPISGTRVYVLDGAMRPVPVGVPGELYAGGAGVARGYVNRPAATAGSFVPDPFGGVPGARLYRTGDRVRWRADGAVEFLGRLDAQVKIRGFRVEPGEVEAALRGHPAAGDCAVVVQEDTPGEKRLVAYVTGNADAAGLRAHLRRTLPEPMLPAAFVPVARIPLTANGKVDRRALPAPGHAAAHPAAPAPPRTPVEDVLAGIWAELLRLEQVGVHDDFFELGGHSLLATRTVSRIRAVFGVELPLHTLFEGPTVAELAGAVEALRRGGLPVLPPVTRASRAGPLPLSFAQERLWFLDRLQPGSAAYNVNAALRVRGGVDAAALERALGRVIQRHETLRTTFAEAGGAPVQVIAPFSGFTLPVHDLSALPAPAREAEVRRRAAGEAARPFDLSAGPIFRASLLRLGGEEHVLLLAMHHVASDGWSMGVFFGELWALYGQGGDAPLPELPVQYADYAVWQRAQLRGAALDRELAWWRERLAGAPALLDLPADHPRPAVQSFRGARVPVELAPGLAPRLRALGRREGATPFMVLLAGFQLLLGQYAGSDDVVVGTPVAARSRREVEGLIGFFANTLALRTGLSGRPTFRQVLRRVREATLGACEHADVPFERVVEELRPERSLGHSPVFQVMMLLESAGPPAASPAGIRVERVATETVATKFDLTLGFSDDGEGVRGSLDYATDLFERATAERMARHLALLLERLVDGPDLPAADVPMLDEADRARVLHEWNRAGGVGDPFVPVHQRFEAQAARTPDATAVTHRTGALTYRELDERANRLARHLRRRGVRPDVAVAVCLERTPEMVVAVLAVLKAGGAYVPLDPGYPEDRLAFMLADSEVAVVLTQERLRAVLPVLAAVEWVSVDGQRTLIGAESAVPIDCGAGPRTLAYVIYTSGSTGRPKGVAVEHGGMHAYLAWACRTYPARRSVVHSPLSFDLTVTSLFVPLLSGGCADLVEEEAGADGLAGRLRSGGGCGMLKLTPAHLRVLGEQLDGRPAGAGAECLVVGGEALLGEHLELWRRALPETVVVNEYGPTETVVGCCIHAVRAGDAAAGRVPIGRPVPGTRLYVLDAAGRPAPVGVPGELFIGGAQVARGYVRRPALTAARFVPDPFGGEAGARLYRTGDRVRWMDDGTLDYLGRLDEQVKVRGYRVEPGEIEAVLRRHPGVADCAVVTREHAPGDVRLVAYVVGDAGAEALRPHLRRGLPEYMVPSAIVALQALPLTSNGKLDRRALPAPPAAGEERRLKPETEMEARLAALWGELLGADAVGVDDNFFDLGGHSLLLARMQGRLERDTGRGVPLVELFQYPTVRSLAAWLQGEAAGGAAETGAAETGAARAGIRHQVLGRLAPRRGRGA